MKPFIKFEGTIVPIMNDNIDTDQLIPKQYLKSTEKTGFGKYLFDEWRYNEDGSINLDAKYSSDGKDEPVFAEAGTYTVVLKADGYPDLTIEVTK